MCGITAWIDWQRDLTREGDIIGAMTERLQSRGPDASGVWQSTRAALGHRRLSIIDPANGAQPMVRRRGDEEFVITYNGELYNTDEVRDALRGRGYSFATACDTEVLLNAYIEWGEGCLERLNGIFAFAIWNEGKQTLFAARDRLGVKPLFFAEIGSAFLIGSELKALLANPAVKPEVEFESLMEMFFLGPTRRPGSGVFRQVEELKPGWCLIHDRMGTRRRQYWALESRPHEDGFARTTEHLRDLVIDTVKRQLVSDVPIGTLLSGGLDSSLVSSIAARVMREEKRGALATWSVDVHGNAEHFKPTEFVPDQDHPWVEKIAQYLKTDHHRVVLTPLEVVDALTEVVHARDLPGMVDVEASLILFCRAIKKRLTVILSGEGADEVFGGYRWFHQPASYTIEHFPWVRATADRLALLKGEVRDRVDPKRMIRDAYHECLSRVPRLVGESELEAKRREMFFIHLDWWLPKLLERKDRASMASGLEVRVPFCDHRIVEYVWNVPWSMKVQGDSEKSLLRNAMTGFLPEDTLWRKKSPYPTVHSDEYGNAIKARLADLIKDPHCALRDWLDVRELGPLLSDEGIPKRHWFGLAWKDEHFLAYLYQIGIWMRDYRVVLT